jgi:hypothetical protein
LEANVATITKGTQQTVIRPGYVSITPIQSGSGPTTRVVSILEERRSVGDKVLPLSTVATIWHGNDGSSDPIEQLAWNTKLRLLKQAVDEGQVRGEALDLHGRAFKHTRGDVADLIKYFQSREGKGSADIQSL